MRLFDTDEVILRNKKNGCEKSTSRIYANRKIKQHPNRYEIIEQCPKTTKTEVIL